MAYEPPKSRWRVLDLTSRAIIEQGMRRQATAAVRLVAMYFFFYHQYTLVAIADLFDRSRSTIAGWVSHFRKSRTLIRKARKTCYKKFSFLKRMWLVSFYSNNPLAYLHEAKAAFARRWDMSISVSSIWEILHANGLKCKVQVES
jgi:transposase